MAEEEKQDIKTRIISTIVVLSLLGIVFFFYQKNRKSDDYIYYAYFNEVQGLQPSSQVEVNGVRVGKIASVDLTDKQQLKVVIMIQNGVRIKEGTIASLSSGGLTGDKIIKLTEGKGALLENGATLVTNLDTSVLPMSVRITPMLETAKFMLRSSDSGLRAFNLFMNSSLIRSTAIGLIQLEEQTRGFAVISARYNTNCNKLANDIHSANESTADLAAKNEDIDQTIDNTSRSTTALAAKNIGNNVQRLRASISSLGNSFHSMNNNQGALGNMVGNKKTYQSATASFDTLNKSLKETYDDPPGFTILGSSKKKK